MRTNKARGIVFPIQPTLRNQGELLNLNWRLEGKRESLGKYHEALKASVAGQLHKRLPMRVPCREAESRIPRGLALAPKPVQDLAHPTWKRGVATGGPLWVLSFHTSV